jgi:hypothetical protein
MQKEGSSFQLLFLDKPFKKGEIIISIDSMLVVIKEPNDKWYHYMLQYITFGLYKASIYYTVKYV